MKTVILFILLTIPIIAQNSIRDSILTCIDVHDTTGTYKPALSYTIPTIITTNTRFATDSSRPLWVTNRGSLSRQSYTEITAFTSDTAVGATSGKYDTLFVEKLQYLGAGKTLDSAWVKCTLYNIDLTAPQSLDTLMYVNNLGTKGKPSAHSYIIDSFLGEKIRICRKSPRSAIKGATHKIYFYVDSSY